MTTITISPKFQIVIPKAIRDLMRLRAGRMVDNCCMACGRCP